jgi:hypothetical protein
MSSRDGAAWQDYAFDADILTQNGVAGLVFRVTPFQTVTNRNGGKAYFAARPTVGTLPAILDDALPAPDVAFEPRLRVSSGNGVFSYLEPVPEEESHAELGWDRRGFDSKPRELARGR